MANDAPTSLVKCTVHIQRRNQPSAAPAMWGTGTQNGKGTQSDPNYVSRLLARSECLPGEGAKIIVTPLFTLLRITQVLTGMINMTQNDATRYFKLRSKSHLLLVTLVVSHCQTEPKRVFASQQGLFIDALKQYATQDRLRDCQASICLSRCMVGWMVGVEFNAPLDTVYVIQEAVFTANHLTDTDKQNSTGKYR